MAELCLMASHGYPHGLVLHPEQGLSRVSKDSQPLLPSGGSRQELIRSGSLNLRSHPNEDSWKTTIGLSEANQFVKIDSSIRRPVLIDVQDTRPNSVLFSFGVAEKYARYEKILQFLMSGLSEVERAGLDISMLSDLTGLKAVTIDMHQQPFTPSYRPSFHEAEACPSLIYPNIEFYTQKPLLDFVWHLAHTSEIAVHPDGKLLCPGAGSEMKEILSIIAEFHLSKTSTKERKQSVLVPHFNPLGLDSGEGRANISGSLKLDTVKVTPLKCPGKIKLKPSPKKKTNKTNKKSSRERDLYRKNYSHACESLLSLMMNKSRQGKSTILALKKSGPELPDLLTQFSASIAGTGLAVLFSVVCQVACGRVPFCASKLLNTTLGIGLVWLSYGINRLRETVVLISKNSSKVGSKEEEIMRKLDRSVNEIFFRAATIMAVAVLRLA